MQISKREAWTYTPNAESWLKVIIIYVYVVSFSDDKSPIESALDHSFLGRAVPIALVLLPALQALLTRTRRREGTEGALQHARIRELSRNLWMRTSLGLLIALFVMLFSNYYAFVVALMVWSYLDFCVSQPLRAAKKEFTSRREASLAPRKAEDIVPRAAWGLAWAGWMTAVAVAVVGNMNDGAWDVFFHQVQLFIVATFPLLVGPNLARIWLEQLEPSALRCPVLLRQVKAWGTYCITVSFSIAVIILALVTPRGWASGPWFGWAILAACIVALSVAAAGHKLQQTQKTDEPQ